MFGLFHGLAYLPVILSWIGPEPYHSEEDNQKYLHNGCSNGISADEKVSQSSFPHFSFLTTEYVAILK